MIANLPSVDVSSRHLFTQPSAVSLLTQVRISVKEQKSNIEDFIPDSAKLMDKYSLPIKMGFKIVDNYLIVRYRGSTIKNFKESFGKPYEEFIEINEKYFLENELKTLVGVYKIK